MAYAGSGWTDERVETMKKLWLDGLSASQISSELACGLSRNAVIGKLHRLGMTMNGEVYQRRVANGGPVTRKRGERKPRGGSRKFQPVQSAERQAQRIADAERRRQDFRLIEINDQQIPDEQRKTLLELTEHSCRWPVGDPSSEDFFYCGAEAEVRGDALGGTKRMPYCSGHCARAFESQSQRRTREARTAQLRAERMKEFA